MGGTRGHKFEARSHYGCASVPSNRHQAINFHFNTLTGLTVQSLILDIHFPLITEIQTCKRTEGIPVHR